MKRIQKGQRLATDAASRSQHEKRVGACVMKKNKVLSVGCNSYKTHPASGSYCKYHHAEFDALIGLTRSDTLGATIFVARLRKDNKLAISKPCKSCQEMIDAMGIKKVVYVNREGKWQNT